MDYATRFSAEGTVTHVSPTTTPEGHRALDLRDAAVDEARLDSRACAARCSSCSPFGSLIVILVFFSIASPYFFTPSNLVGILMAATVTGILALGTTFVIISGGIDLSIGTGMILCGVMTGRVPHLLGLAALGGRARRDPVRWPDRIHQRRSTSRCSASRRSSRRSA